MKYKIGDKVRIRKDLKTLEIYGSQLFVEQMEKYKGTPVTISEVFSDTYYIKEDKDNWNWTDEMFEAENELTAEEAIRLRYEMCTETSCCDCGMSKHNNNNMGVSCSELQQKYPERAVEILKQWKADHEKKKEVETEIVHLIKVMKEEGDSTTCIYTYEVKEDKDDIDEKMDKLVKQYYEENGGKIYAKLERICRAKS